MRDKIALGYGIPAVFCTNPDYGMLLAFPDGQIDLRRKTLFNLARRRMNFGCSIFRVLRHAPWKNPVRFDIDDPRYWPLFFEFCDILHQPYQKAGAGQGADVWLEPFDGCGAQYASDQTTLDKEWIFSDEGRVRRTLGNILSMTSSRPFIKVGCGNEIGGTLKQCLCFHEIVFEEFKYFQRVPFSFGATYSTTDDNLEHVKKMAGEKRFWGDTSNKWIFREVHKVRDRDSQHLIEVVEQWGNRPIRFALQADGVKPRPNMKEWMSVLEYLFEKIRTKNLRIPRPADTPLKIIMELFGEVGEIPDPNVVLAMVSEVYKGKFGSYPVNHGKYPDDWKEPVPPEPPDVEIVLVEICKKSRLLPNAYCPDKEVVEWVKGMEPTLSCNVHHPPKPCGYFLKRLNIWHWLRCVLFGKH